MITKTNACLVAKSYSQIESADFFDTFSPTPSVASIRTVVSIASVRGLDFYNFDVGQAFTQFDLDCDIFMGLPRGCGRMPCEIVQLNKYLYGLKQSTCQRQKNVGRHSTRQLFQTLPPGGSCMMRSMVWDKPIPEIVVLIDDTLFAGGRVISDTVVQALDDTFPTEHLGELTSFMGSGYARDRKSVTLRISRKNIIKKVVDCFPVAPSCTIPASPFIDLGNVKVEDAIEGVPFQEVMGSLMW